MVATKWEVSDRHKSQRTITYKHPLHVPMGPPHGLAEKTQTIHRYGDHGLCVISKIVTKGVPMADCFYIEDCLLVSSNGSSGGISVSIMFELCFFTSTMFKKVISMTTINELLKFHNGFIKYIQQGLSNDADINNTGTEKSDDKDKLGMNIVQNMISSDPSMEHATDGLANPRDRSYVKIFSATARKLSAVEPFVLGLVFAILLNQFFLLSKIKSLQGNIHVLESLVEKSRRNRMDSMFDENSW